jgi:hypothetical protein
VASGFISKHESRIVGTVAAQIARHNFPSALWIDSAPEVPQGIDTGIKAIDTGILERSCAAEAKTGRVSAASVLPATLPN